MEPALRSLNEWAASKPSVVTVADACGVKPGMVVVAGCACAAPFLIFGIGGNLLVTLIGMLLPALESYKAVIASDSVAMQYLLKYWVCFTCLTAVEAFLDPLVLWVIPIWGLVKLAGLLWLLKGGGADRVFPLMQPYLERVSPAVDSIIKGVTQTGLATTLSNAGKEAGKAE